MSTISPGPLSPFVCCLKLFTAGALVVSGCTDTGPGATIGSATETSGATTADESATTAGDATGAAPGTDTEGGETASETEGEDPETAGLAADGEPCVVDGDCASGACLKRRDHDPAATCIPVPGGAKTRVTGTVVDLASGQVIAGAELRVLDTLTALQNPAGAPILLSAVGDREGLIDLVTESPFASAIGLLSFIVGDGLAPTLSPLADPRANGTFGPTNTYHDLWSLPEDRRLAWEGLLAGEPAAAAHLPFGEKGGAVALLRDAATGIPRAGVTLAPEDPMSSAVVRYLGATGDSLTDEATADHGLALIVGAKVTERFIAAIAGEPVAEGEAQSVAGAITVMVIPLPE